MSHTCNHALEGSGRVCQLHIISDNNLSTLNSYLLLIERTACLFDI